VDPRTDPLVTFGEKLRGRGRGRRRKLEPTLESWEQVVPAAAPEAETAPTRDFVITKKESDTETAEDSEQDTQETFAVASVREVTTEEDVADWGFDDDPADYSAAV
jgi:hypothetical protein